MRIYVGKSLTRTLPVKWKEGWPQRQTLAMRPDEGSSSGAAISVDSGTLTHCFSSSSACYRYRAPRQSAIGEGRCRPGGDDRPIANTQNPTTAFDRGEAFYARSHGGRHDKQAERLQRSAHFEACLHLAAPRLSPGLA